MSEEEFEGLLREAAAALASNEPERAEQTALAALRLRPGNPLAQNVVGLSYFGQGRHDQALEVFDSLARRNADVVPLRINAGVAALKAGDRARAEIHLRRAIDLDSGQRRAFAYLALIHLEEGQRELARAALREAGLADLAEQAGEGGDLPEVLASEAARIPPAEPTAAPWEGYTEVAAIGGGAEGKAAALDADAGAAPGQDEAPGSVDGEGEPGAEQGAADDGADADQGLDESFANLDAAFAQLESAPRVESPAEAPSEAPAAPPAAPADAERPVRTTKQRLASLKPPRSAFCFAVFPEVPSGVELPDVELHNAAEEDDRRCLVIGPRALADGVNIRRDLLVLAHGALESSAPQQREKGARTGPLVIDGHPVTELRGEGKALLATDAADCFEIVRLSDEACCVAESAVAVFSSQLRWERGRVPGTTHGAYELVGRGFVGLSCRAPLERVRLRPGEHLTVRSDCLVGWGGGVVPCVSAGEADGGSHGGPVHLECGGQGMVVVCLAGGVAGGLNADALRRGAVDEGGESQGEE